MITEHEGGNVVTEESSGNTGEFPQSALTAPDNTPDREKLSMQLNVEPSRGRDPESLGFAAEAGARPAGKSAPPLTGNGTRRGGPCWLRSAADRRFSPPSDGFPPVWAAHRQCFLQPGCPYFSSFARATPRIIPRPELGHSESPVGGVPSARYTL